MLGRLKSSFGSAVESADERDQKQRTLTILLWAELGIAILIGLVNLRLGALTEAAMLFTTAVVCVPAILLNARGHYELAGGLASLMILVTIDMTLYEARGLHDGAVVAVPLFVMLGALVFSRRYLLLFLAAALVSVIAIGMMDLVQWNPQDFDRNLADVIVVSLLTLASALIVWVTVGNLEENLRRARTSESELREAYDRTLEGWARALELRDSETHGHARRVVRLCLRLAQEWGFGAQEMAHIRRGALLHDIGKMALPDHILLKRGRLTPSEWKVMKQHPVVAEHLLRQIPYLGPALSIPTFHHERWDGRGYPRGARGKRIPIEARIFAVVDQYDALTSNRPYRKAWPREKALSFIRANAGGAFDPDVCATFVRLYEAGAFGRDV